MFGKFARSCITFLTGIVCLALLVLPQILDKDLLFDRAVGYTFYSQSESSQAMITLAAPSEALKVKRSLASVTGESARYLSEEEAFAQVKKYDGKFVFSESAAEVTNYYFYSVRLGGGVELYGQRVNLHVAVRGEEASVGCPLVFGGY